MKSPVVEPRVDRETLSWGRSPRPVRPARPASETVDGTINAGPNRRVVMWLAVAAVSGLGLLLAVAEAGAASRGAAASTHPAKTSDVGHSLKALIEADWIDRDVRFSEEKNGPKPGGPVPAKAPSVTTRDDAAGGCDGVKNGRYGFHTASGETDAWWQVDLGQAYRLDRVVIFNRTDGNTAPRTRNIRVLVASESPARQFTPVYQHNGQTYFGVLEKKPLVVDLKGKPVSARFVRLQIPGRCSFALDEVEVYGVDQPGKNLALGKPADQKSVGRYSCRKTAGAQPAVATGFRASGADFSTAHIRHVLAQAQKLAARLRPKAELARLEPLAAELKQIEGRLAKAESAGAASLAVRRDLYFQARWLARRIALLNPLLKIESLLFVKRHDASGVFHMCDQFYGCNAVPGGGLFVLRDPSGPNPRLVDLLADSVVQRGRLAGQRLTGGSFLSPELSFDGKTILFAYSEAKAFAKSQGKETYLWAPEYSYHIFRVNADGTNLVQLTDGPTDDFDPCFLPNGRIAFISERRGGYLRCGRHCPVYTMFSMNADGGDIICLSYHETHEWQPSVTNDGMLVYSRWDYVDRDTNVAHHIWTCYPDGRNPRSFHGNYPERRESRPWMEMDIRAIPDSGKFVATTGAHHGHAFGSLVLIDPRIVDDGASSQLTRLTPEVPFPESEARPIDRYMVYGTPWPLSEDDYLCAYDPAAKNHGIYWIDRFGNKELIYRDASIASISPMPLGRRSAPPVVPSQTFQAAEDAARASSSDRRATVAVMNVYDSDFAWPKGTSVKALRIVQVLPKLTAPPNVPRIGVADQTNARAVLGTVPVEPDGSAHFEAPAGKALYFQALDERGLAIQSMRSATYLHPGERMTCQGCHESKQRPPSLGSNAPLAMQRAPDKIRPDVSGSNPFTFVRLVQPALDRHCVSCHRQKKALDLTGVIEGKYGWTRSYSNLAGKYGFYFHVSNGSINKGVHGGSRTVAGKFGAAASPLLRFLDARHYGLKLPAEDFHRITLWLDCNSEFYGAYENTEAQSRGEIVIPSLE